MGKMNELSVLAWNAGVHRDFETIDQLKVHVAKQLLVAWGRPNHELVQLGRRFSLYANEWTQQRLARELTYLTKDEAISLPRRAELYHYRERNADGTPLRVFVNGKCQTWKTRPDEFRLPVKYGLRNCLDITDKNAWEWFKL